MIDQEPVDANEEKQDEPKPADEPPPIATGVSGNGPADGFGLSGRGGGPLIGGSGNGNRGNRSKWGWYAGQVQSRVTDSLRQNRKTRAARLEGMKVRIWADPNGRVTRAQLTDSSGNPQVDQAIQGEVLSGLQLSEPPPAGMPMPIVLRLNARRPH